MISIEELIGKKFIIFGDSDTTQYTITVAKRQKKGMCYVNWKDEGRKKKVSYEITIVQENIERGSWVIVK